MLLWYAVILAFKCTKLGLWYDALIDRYLLDAALTH